MTEDQIAQIFKRDLSRFAEELAPKIVAFVGGDPEKVSLLTEKLERDFQSIRAEHFPLSIGEKLASLARQNRSELEEELSKLGFKRITQLKPIQFKIRLERRNLKCQKKK